MPEETKGSEDPPEALSDVAATSTEISSSTEEGIESGNGNNQGPGSSLDDSPVANGNDEIQGSSMENCAGDDNVRMENTPLAEDRADGNLDVEGNEEEDSVSEGNLDTLRSLAHSSDFAGSRQDYDISRSSAALNSVDSDSHDRSPIGSSSDESDSSSEPNSITRLYYSGLIARARRNVMRRRNRMRMNVTNSERLRNNSNCVEIYVGERGFEIITNTPTEIRNVQPHISINSSPLPENYTSSVYESDEEDTFRNEYEVDSEESDVENEEQEEVEADQREGEQFDQLLINEEILGSSSPPDATQRNEASIDPAVLTAPPSCTVCKDSQNEILSSSRHFVSTECGHVFCSTCMTRIMNRNLPCPACGKLINFRRVHRIFL